MIANKEEKNSLDFHLFTRLKFLNQQLVDKLNIDYTLITEVT